MKRWFWGLPWILILAATLQGQSRESLLKSVSETSKWSPADKPAEYDEKNIQDLAGNRAPAIRRYGFVGATRQSWRGADGTVGLTLYEMFDASAAYGLFTLERDINQSGFSTASMGSEAYRVGNRSYFWQSKYVVKLEGSALAADGLARIISENIFGRSRKPPVSSHLPPANLVSGSEKYILDGPSIGRQFQLNPETLGFDDSVEIATASYNVAGKTAHLALLLYPTQQVAKKYADQWQTENPNDAAFRKRVGPLVALVRGSRDPALAKTILDDVNYETQVTWNEQRPDVSFREVILTIFTFIGVALAFTLIVGVSFGGLRIFLKARFPDRVFDRSQDLEIIQLKLGQGLTRKELKD